jgi:hypothetical protein
MTAAKQKIAGDTNERCRAYTDSSHLARSNVVFVRSIVPVMIFSPHAAGR